MLYICRCPAEPKEKERKSCLRLFFFYVFLSPASLYDRRGHILTLRKKKERTVTDVRSIAVFPTLTAAERARRALAAAAIPAETVKVDSSRTRRGCSWGVAFFDIQLRGVMAVFGNAGIKTREIISG